MAEFAVLLAVFAAVVTVETVFVKPAAGPVGGIITAAALTAARAFVKADWSFVVDCNRGEPAARGSVALARLPMSVARDCTAALTAFNEASSELTTTEVAR